MFVLLFVFIEASPPSKQFFSYVGMEPTLPGFGSPHGRVVKSADISLPHLTIRSSHRCVWCGFEPRSGHM